MRAVRVVERRLCWALSVEMWDWVCEASVESEGDVCWGFADAAGDRQVFRWSMGEKVGDRKGLSVVSARCGFLAAMLCATAETFFLEGDPDMFAAQGAIQWCSGIYSIRWM